MRFLIATVLAVLPVLSFAQQDDRAELDRLRRENAQLRKDLAAAKDQLAKATAELEKTKAGAGGAAVTPPPKAMAYTPEMIVKLIPREDLPDGSKWDPAKRERVKKILGAHLEGEWVQLAVQVERVGEEAKPFKLFARQPAGPLGVSMLLDFAFAERPANAPKRAGQTVTIVGRVSQAGLYPEDANQVILALTECRIK